MPAGVCFASHFLEEPAWWAAAHQKKKMHITLLVSDQDRYGAPAAQQPELILYTFTSWQPAWSKEKNGLFSGALDNSFIGAFLLVWIILCAAECKCCPCCVISTYSPSHRTLQSSVRRAVSAENMPDCCEEDSKRVRNYSRLYRYKQKASLWHYLRST